MKRETTTKKFFNKHEDTRTLKNNRGTDPFTEMQTQIADEYRRSNVSRDDNQLTNRTEKNSVFPSN